MRNSRSLRCVSIVAMAVSGTLAAATAAAADPTPAPRRHGPAPAKGKVKATARLVSHGFDRAVANAHGYEIVLLDGEQAAVKVSDGPIRQDGVKTAGSALRASGAPVKYGDCGVSFLYYASMGDRKADVYTGFDVTKMAPAVGFTWEVSVTDSIGVGSRTWREPLAGYSWDTHWETEHGTTGYSEARVTGGKVVLADGEVCTQFGPWQSTTLY
ncbi:hypothetical protein [Actinomadura parmotrematis]|uniref:Secreted protein n=1 Tax=Actinomadura parmotrematis TaxID=2864039 RepID=A0ABS7FNF6_9ACTN|nr:hypothetical protein [Actinomadura parmotrematis]MBW8481891.1 hypothetical protein [Actinomadura parmotrematis]